MWALRAVLQDALDDSQGDGGVQLDPAQLAEYRQLKTQADDKARGLLQEKTGLEAQLKVGLGLCRQCALLVLCGLAVVNVLCAAGNPWHWPGCGHRADDKFHVKSPSVCVPVVP